MNKITVALVIAKPGHLRNSLQSLLRTIPQIEILAESNDPSILQKIDGGIRPELILMDGGLVEISEWSLVEQIKAVLPDTKILILTDDDIQGKAAREAGADHYLLKGFPATELAQLIETMLIQDTDDGKPVVLDN